MMLEQTSEEKKKDFQDNNHCFSSDDEELRMGRALTVRFLTRRFIGDYDPNLDCNNWNREDLHLHAGDRRRHRGLRGPGHGNTDRCSLNECLRLKFLINSYGKRNRKLSVALPETALSSNPVALVGNQNDRSLDRMIPMTEGWRAGAQLGCVAFYEISVRECCDSVHTIFEDLYTCYKRPKKFRAVYPRRAVSVCSFDTINSSDNGGASGTNDDSEAAAEDDGERIKVGEAVTSVNPDTRCQEEGSVTVH
ncbi:hypothetical protein C0Q70_11199 [Pomacea canaliculata]|uniref:small monomeric GTPase n=1 Tax=Pomacea canaliculata TaxID=400727 RepID=A0A2T7P5C4_POMCA|nr:hypothetical protein C0Q70_11199 [Pomacea canaliculata]